MARRSGLLGSAVALAAVAWAVGQARAESDLVLDFPTMLGTTPASTYDVNRKRVGDAHLVVEELEDGKVRLISESGFTGGARTVVSALFQPIEDGRKLRPLRQESRSFDDARQPLGRLLIDHVEGVASCFDTDGNPSAELAIPSEDRVANTTLSFLFLPLVRGDTDEVAFQLFFCGLGTRFVTFTANRAPTNGKDPNVVEVRYGPDFGFATLVAASFVPKLSFWFDPESPHRWLAHRLPLYGRGPEVYVIRKGVPPRWLKDE